MGVFRLTQKANGRFFFKLSETENNVNGARVGLALFNHETGKVRHAFM